MGRPKSTKKKSSTPLKTKKKSGQSKRTKRKPASKSKSPRKRTSSRKSKSSSKSNPSPTVSQSTSSSHMSVAGELDTIIPYSSNSAAPIVKRLKVCPTSCSCPSADTWFVCKYCLRAHETRDGLRKHRTDSVWCHKRPISKVSTKFVEEKCSTGVKETDEFVEFEDLTVSDEEESRSTAAVDDGEISDGDSSNASTVFVIHKSAKLRYTTSYDMDSAGPSSDCHREYSDNRRTIQMTC